MRSMVEGSGLCVDREGGPARIVRNYGGAVSIVSCCTVRGCIERIMSIAAANLARRKGGYVAVVA